MSWFKIILPIILFSTLSAWAKLVDLSPAWLYKRNDQKDYYAKAVAMIKPGDVVKFRDGATFTIEEKLGQGGLSYIYSIRERPHQVLRLANSLGTLSSMNETLEGYHQLVDTGVRVVEIDPNSASQYILTEKVSRDYLTIAEMVLNVDFGGERFFYDTRFALLPMVQKWRYSKIKKMPKLDPETREYMMNAFWYFVKSIAKFHVIADLHEANVVYDRHNDEWIILDWLKGSKGMKHTVMIEESTRHMMKELFKFLDTYQENGIELTDESKAEFAQIKEKTRTTLIKEKARYVQLATQVIRERNRCQGLL